MTAVDYCIDRPIVFDRPARSLEHALWVFAHRLIARNDEETTQVGSGVPVAIFNILPFKRKARLNLDELYRKHGGMVARRVRRFVSVDDVEEVVQEVFLKAFERQDSYRGDASPVTWLYHIATNHCLNRIRDQRRRRNALELNKDLPWLRPTSEARSETMLLLQQVWSLLDEKQSTIAMYYFVDGLSHAEIARITDVSRRTIGNRIDEITNLIRQRTEKGS